MIVCISHIHTRTHRAHRQTDRQADRWTHNNLTDIHRDSLRFNKTYIYTYIHFIKWYSEVFHQLGYPKRKIEQGSFIKVTT